MFIKRGLSHSRTLLGFSFILFCFSSCDSFDDSSTAVVVTPPPSLPLPDVKAPVAPVCQWDFPSRPPNKGECNGQVYCVRSLSCQPGPRFKIVVCREQNCASPQTCLADHSPETKLCAWKWSSQIP